ncbi:unnamed protein product [Linum trigynum]|uniref:non-specific serine/threonine protein kinase n=1 Tax=Linum trigynum TaxID=586398 RepID=A0AAV2DHI6_9ROSI
MDLPNRLLLPPFLFFFFFSVFLFRATATNDAVTPAQPLKDGDVLISETGKFALGFFSPGRSTNRYLGIWFHEVPELTVIWVANRNDPIAAGDSGFLSIDSTGNLVLFAGDGEDQNRNRTQTQVPIWSTNVSAGLDSSSPRSARILDSGNFALFSSSNSTILWQSVDYPTNTFLPGAKLGLDRKSGLDRFLNSWRSEDDPATGKFSFRLNPKGSPQFFLYEDGKPYSRSFPWPWGSYGEIFNVSFVNNEEATFFEIALNDDSFLFWEVLDSTGVIREKIWRKGYDGWKEYWATPTQKCDSYRRCGANGLCDPSNFNTFECSCLPGYVPRSPRSWRLFDGSGGCVRKPSKSGSKLELDFELKPELGLGTSDGFCGVGEGFVRVPKVKTPESSGAVWVENEGGGELSCERECRKNCSCSAYAEIDATLKEKGCLLWYGELADTVYFPVSFHDLYVRVDAEEFANYQGGSNNSLELKLKLSILLPSIGSVGLVVIVIAFFRLRKWRNRTAKKRRIRNLFHPNDGSNHFTNSVVTEQMEGHAVYPELPFFSLNAIRAATDNFSPANTLGRGGFGSVYKGRLPNGQEIAVKKLSENSRQGLEQFRNEVLLIAKLQHRNLVKLHGCCIEEEEQMLIYEYLPNRSLDLFLFDRKGGTVLDWTRRFSIIVGIARGILYLHQDSRFRIIHRDLKTSNILLDGELNPKISDFGMAMILEADQVHGKTSSIGGTYGYMSPEYAVFGKFSEKSDVFSFGVILLEMITGKKINRVHSEDENLNLITYVWERWKEEKALEVVDSSMEGSLNAQEVLKCIQIGLLCVEEDVQDRPNMSMTVLMLNTAMPLPLPKQPGFPGTSCFKKPRGAAEGSFSVNEMFWPHNLMDRDRSGSGCLLVVIELYYGRMVQSEFSSVEIALFVRLIGQFVQAQKAKSILSFNNDPATANGVGDDGSQDSGTARLRQLRNKQELKLDLSCRMFSNFAFSFSIILVLPGITTLYYTGLTFGSLLHGWFIAGLFTMFVGSAMGEICSAYPTSCGLCSCSPRQPFLGAFCLLEHWLECRFNIVGQWAVTARVDFFLAQMIQVIILLSTGGQNGGGYQASKFVVIALHSGILFLHASSQLSQTERTSAKFVFTHFNNDNGDGINNKLYFFVLGLLMSQYTLTGYDASAHMTEETKSADKNGPKGTISSIGISVIFGYAIAEIFYQAFKRRYESGFVGIICLGVVAVAIFFCGMSSVTSNSRMAYAFSRDGAMPFYSLWHKVNVPSMLFGCLSSDPSA